MTEERQHQSAREELRTLIYDGEGDICDLPRIIKGLEAAVFPPVKQREPWEENLLALFTAAACHAEHVKAHYYRVFDAFHRVEGAAKPCSTLGALKRLMDAAHQLPPEAQDALFAEAERRLESHREAAPCA